MSTPFWIVLIFVVATLLSGLVGFKQSFHKERMSQLITEAQAQDVVSLISAGYEGEAVKQILEWYPNMTKNVAEEIVACVKNQHGLNTDESEGDIDRAA